MEGLSMGRPTSTVERAFEMARGGEYRFVSVITKALRREGYDPTQIIASPTLQKQLNEICRQACGMPTVSEANRRPRHQKLEPDGP